MIGWIIAGTVIAAGIAAAFACSHYERSHVRFPRYEVEAPGLGKTFDGYTMVVLADLHENGAGRRNNRMLAEIRRIHPDAVIVAGDLVMAKHGNAAFSETIHWMKRLAYRYPVYYGLGNHEARMGWKPEEYGDAYARWYEEMKRAGVTVLDNVSLTLRNGADALTITGLDLDRRYYKKVKQPPLEPGYLEKTLGVAGKGEYHILLAHSPCYFKDYAAWGADLVFSGHYHGGTIRLPLLGGVIAPNFHPFPRYSRGKYTKNGTMMIVSGGLGTHSVNFRLGNCSEVPVVTLRAAKEQGKQRE